MIVPFAPIRIPGTKALVALVVLAVAFGLKLHYARAGPDALGWILAPTAGLVEAVTGLAFELEAGTGYLSRSAMFAVTKSCAGLNFLIVAFAMLALGGAWAARSGRDVLSALGRAAVVGYVATILANALRIVVAMGVEGEDAHRLVGVVVYFVVLLALYGVFLGRRGGLVPLGFYLGGTLFVPLVHGWFRGRPLAWSTHVLVLLTVPPALVLLLGAARAVLGWRARRTATSS